MSSGLATEFETHLTLAASRTEDLEAARRWAVQSGLKWTEIELSRGQHPHQPMITFWGSDTLELQQQQTAEIERELSSMGLKIVRVKIETGTSDSLYTEPGQYFESHIKLHLTDMSELSVATEIALQQSAYVSRNARRIYSDGTQERFLTLRSYDCRGGAANARQQCLLDAVWAAKLEVMEVESEFVIFDSNVDLDKGWEASDE